MEPKQYIAADEAEKRRRGEQIPDSREDPPGRFIIDNEIADREKIMPELVEEEGVPYQKESIGDDDDKISGEHID